MQQPMAMGSLAPHATRLPAKVRAVYGRRSFRFGHGHRLLRTSQARLGRVMAVDAAQKSCLLQDPATTVCKNSRLLDHDAQAVGELDTVRKEDKYFEVEMTVRDDDLDEYGVVNNAIYISYIHIGRQLVLEKLGINVHSLAATGKFMALSELHAKYYAPLRTDDRFVVKVKPVKIKGIRMIVHHMIEVLPDRKLVLEAKGTVVFLNGDYSPTRVFPEVSVRAREMFPCMEV